MTASTTMDSPAAGPETRPAPPPLPEPRCPDCSVCGNETTYVDETFECSPCGCDWPADGRAYDQPGSWLDPDAKQCTATVQPLADSTFASEEARAEVYRCARDLGHDGNHASTDYTYNVKGWDW